MASDASSNNYASSLGHGSSPNVIVLHILCPSFPPPSRFTINNVPLSTTIAALKTRISDSIPSRPSPESQRLIYRGKPLSDNNVILQDILEPVDTAVHTLHLVLPPGSTPSASSSAASSTLSQEPSHLPAQHRNSRPFTRFSQSTPPQNIQGMRYRGTGISSRLGEAEIGIALQRNIETLRRQVELQARGRWPLRQGVQETATVGRSHPISTQPLLSFSQPHTLQRMQQNPFYPPPSGTSQSPWTSSPSIFTTPADVSGLGSNSSHISTMDSQFAENPRLRLEALRQQIALSESQLNQGTAPPLNQIIRIRTELLNLLDNQYRDPLSQRDGVIESLLSRVLNVYTRADQLRVIQPRCPSQDRRESAGLTFDSSRAPAYLLSSPSGYQALLASPNATQAIQTSLAAIHSTQTSTPSPTLEPTPTANTRPEPDPVALENAVRQAVLNQRPRNNGNNGLARHVRRAWLFIRLYFFCYMFSEPGTWSHIFLVSLAVLTSLLSETSVPGSLYRLLLAPIQRHLEGLLQFGVDEPLQQPAPSTGNEPSQRPGEQAQTIQETHTTTVAQNETGASEIQLWRGFRRIERSFALFVASLIPGVGERHVEARNAAEAAWNAARARVEEERRRQDEAQDGGNEDQFGSAENSAYQDSTEQEASTTRRNHEDGGNQANEVHSTANQDVGN
ncbi:hypothetical protein MPDQ_005529 [Monascus purpureus]|uniref:Ubiquitin-like domain-containing protein n=1 Tax=Monascus purpureus TaxID=5098 RepID=A0A507R5L8_MONPU|nr:hypothetical protein MPDQ_005529 [Monascus purpureus]BDD57407.1 hypothetical protein MAP00_002770 [Monascus purpureus]